MRSGPGPPKPILGRSRWRQISCGRHPQWSSNHPLFLESVPMLCQILSQNQNQIESQILRFSIQIRFCLSEFLSSIELQKIPPPRPLPTRNGQIRTKNTCSVSRLLYVYDQQKSRVRIERDSWAAKLSQRRSRAEFYCKSWSTTLIASQINSH